MSDLNNSSTENENNILPLDGVQFDNARVQEILFKNRIQGGSRGKKLMGLLVLLILLAVSGYGLHRWLGNSQDAEYSAVTIGKTTISDCIEATGTLSPVKESAMGFKNDDTITAINVQAGDQVKSGQILAQQDPTSLQTALQQAQSTLNQDQITVQTANLTWENNRKTLERQQKLLAAGAIAQTDLDTAQDNYLKSQWELASAQSKLVNDQTKLAQAQSDLAAATLLAPFDGIIGAVNGQVGQINGINSSASTLLTIMSTDLQLTALVNEADIGRIKLGQEVEFSSSAYGNQIFKGQVLRITPQASTVSNVQYYPVLISCIDPDHQLLSGMSVIANIIVNRKYDVLSVPMMAVSYAQTYLKNHPPAESPNSSPRADIKMNASSQTRPQQLSTNSPLIKKMDAANDIPATGSSAMETAKPAMVLVMNDKQITVKNVLLGLSDGSRYEVIKGLNEGEQVVVGSNQLSSDTGSSDSSSDKSGQNQRNFRGTGIGGHPPGM